MSSYFDKVSFYIGCYLPNGQRTIVNYDLFNNVYSNNILDIKSCTNILNDEKAKILTDTVSRTINIFLGYNCNAKCKYCAIHPTDDKYSGNLKDVDNFIKKLESYKDINPRQFCFLGGEPFVYIKLMKKMVPLIKKIFPKVSFTIITNGTLFTKETIDWIETNDINILVSHDGTAKDKYRPDALQYPYTKELFRIRNHKIGFQLVPLPNHTNVEKSYEYLCNEIGKEVSLTLIPLKTNQANCLQIRYFTKEEKEILTNSIYKLLLKYDKNVICGCAGTLLLLRVLLKQNISESSYYLTSHFELDGKYDTQTWFRRYKTGQNSKCCSCILARYCNQFSHNVSSFWQEISCFNNYYPYYMGIMKYVFKKYFYLDVNENEIQIKNSDARFK